MAQCRHLAEREKTRVGKVNKVGTGDDRRTGKPEFYNLPKYLIHTPSGHYAHGLTEKKVSMNWILLQLEWFCERFCQVLKLKCRGYQFRSAAGQSGSWNSCPCPDL